MIEVLYFSQKDVTQRLLDRVRRNHGLLLVTGVRHTATMKPVAEREPFATLENWFGEVLDQVVVADEGSVEGMWRDPLGSLGDMLYPGQRSEAYLVANGYVVIREGAPVALLKKRSKAELDIWHIQQALSAVDARVPPPDPDQRPAQGFTDPGMPMPNLPPRQAEIPTPPRGRPAAAAAPAPAARAPSDPWALLGIARGTPLGEARKAFRALIAQYHPDKVAHLAGEFRVLAEEKTRQILDAWRRIEEEAKGGGGETGGEGIG